MAPSVSSYNAADQVSGMTQGVGYAVEISMRGGTMYLEVDRALQSSVAIVGGISSGESAYAYFCHWDSTYPCSNAQIRRLSYSALPSPPPSPPSPPPSSPSSGLAARLVSTFEGLQTELSGSAPTILLAPGTYALGDEIDEANAAAF